MTAFRLSGVTIPADVARTAQDGQTVFEPNGSPVRRWRTETAKSLPGFNHPRPDLREPKREII